jgi:hypothetical protein
MKSEEQWRLVAKISGGAAPENCIFFINWGWLLTLSLRIIYCTSIKKERKKDSLYVIDNIKWQQGVL